MLTCDRDLEGGGVRRRPEGAHERRVGGELPEEAAVKLSAVAGAIVRAHRGGDQLLAELGERPGSADGAVEVEMGVKEARAHAVGAVVRNDPPEGTLDPLVGFLEKPFRPLLARHVNPCHG